MYELYLTPPGAKWACSKARITRVALTGFGLFSNCIWPCAVGDEPGPGTSSMDVEVPVEAAQPAGHMHKEQNGVHEPAAAAAAQPMAVES